MNKKICQMVADRVLEEIAKGVAPWNQPWFSVNRFVSHVTGKRYSLLNCLMLGEPGEYATFKQISEEGGVVKKGAKSKVVVFWQPKKELVSEDGEIVEKVWFILRYYRVFNLNDCDGIEAKYLKETQGYEHDVVSEAEQIVQKYADDNTGLRIVRDKRSDGAYYRPSEDMICVPEMGQFEKIEEFYSTLFHEMTHSTGHWTRLGRFGESGKVSAFGGEEYGKEELIAELGAAALCGQCGVESNSSFKNSAAYLEGWTKAIQGNPEMIVSAAGKADKAVEFILGVKE